LVRYLGATFFKFQPSSKPSTLGATSLDKSQDDRYLKKHCVKFISFRDKGMVDKCITITIRFFLGKRDNGREKITD